MKYNHTWDSLVEYINKHKIGSIIYRKEFLKHIDYKVEYFYLLRSLRVLIELGCLRKIEPEIGIYEIKDTVPDLHPGLLYDIAFVTLHGYINE